MLETPIEKSLKRIVEIVCRVSTFSSFSARQRACRTVMGLEAYVERGVVVVRGNGDCTSPSRGWSSRLMYVSESPNHSLLKCQSGEDVCRTLHQSQLRRQQHRLLDCNEFDFAQMGQTPLVHEEKTYRSCQLLACGMVRECCHERVHFPKK